jgi:hypothetical protein
MADDDDIELTQEYCMRRAARSLMSLYKTGKSQEIFDNTLACVDRWIALATEARLGAEQDLRRFEEIKQTLVSK